MRKWIAEWLMHLAFRIDAKATVLDARLLVTAADWAQQLMEAFEPKPPKNRGRPLGSKDTKPRKSYVRKVQP